MKSRVPWKAIIVSTLFLLLGFIVNYYATSYADVRASNYVEDIVLSNVPTFNLDGSFVIGPIVFWIIISVFILQMPKKIPFVFDATALLLLIRSGFISLTHFGPFPSHMVISGDFFHLFSTGADLFFSGHTAVPYLLALIFWDHLWLRRFCLVSAIFFGVIVLLAHVHYSIDVAAAFFITYSIYHIAVRWFKKDLALFKEAALV